MSEHATKFQWSKTSKDGEMYVIRTDDQAEFDLLVAKYKEKLGNSRPAVQAPVQNGNESKSCQVHNVPMEWRISKKTGKGYWSHKDGENLCFGR